MQAVVPAAVGVKNEAFSNNKPFLYVLAVSQGIDGTAERGARGRFGDTFCGA